MTESITDLFLKPVQRVLDRGVRYSTTAAALCERLDGKVFQIQPGPEGWAVYFEVAQGRLLMRQGTAPKADATISGSVINLARLTAADAGQLIRDGHIKISGDTEVAEDFRALLDIVRPDWEEALSKVVGDPLAHEAGRTFRDVRNWAAKARQSLGRSLGEYLTEESRDLAAATELDEFCADVDALAQGVDRAEARLKVFKEQQAKAGA